MKQATIRDLALEAWLRRRDKGEIVWQTKSGEIIPIQKMSDTHLFNAINKFSQYEEMKNIGIDRWDLLGLDD